MITLKEMRTTAGFTVKQVAKELDVSEQMVYMWEAGRRGLPAITLQQLYTFYNIPNITLRDIVLPNPPSRKQTLTKA